MATRPVRVGLCGFGYWGPELARNVQATEGLRLTAIADPDPGRRALAERLHPGAIVASYPKEIVERPLDAVVVATPLHLHADITLEALARDLHVLVAKPLAPSVSAARKMCDLARKRERVLLVDHTFVYTGAVRTIRELLPSLGELLYFDSVRISLGLVRSDCDVVWDLAAHDLSILLYLLGSLPPHVCAIGADCIGSARAELAHLTLLGWGYPLAHVHVNWLSPVKVRRILIGGSERMLVYDDMEPSEKVRVYDRGARLDEHGLHVDYRQGDCWAPHLDRREALAVELEHFRDCIRGDAEPLTDGHSGVEVVRALEKASASLAEMTLRSAA